MEQYTLEFAVDVAQWSFEVAERVELDVREATRTITCHAVDLQLAEVSLKCGDHVQRCQELRYDLTQQSVSMTFAEAVPAGATATLQMQCHGVLNDQMRGLYRGAYSTGGDAASARYMAVTQFEACDARRAFACWDEPAIKAIFEVSIVADATLTALSNTHVVRTVVRPTQARVLRATAPMEKLWQFAPTPVMPTYLVALVVGEFDFVSAFTREGVAVRVYTPVGCSERGQFALDVATKALSFYADLFGIAYPLYKLDMIAIPDFAAGAMENWGLLTYRETRLLIDEEKSSNAQRLATARTVCHEIAHQWFGNLVTMEWWTGLWLKEGFARFMEYEAVDHIFPNWRVWDVFVHEVTLCTAMAKDAMLTSHPIEVDVHHPDEVDQIFDMIAYAKGASVIRMLCEFVGREVFQRGIHDYLTQFSYRNAQIDDLWRALEKASGQEITSMANSWTRQTGFPVVHVADDSISQQRFLADAKHAQADTTSLWDIPLTYIASERPQTVQRIGIWPAKTQHGATNGVTMPLQADASVQQQLPPLNGTNTWIKWNPGQAGFYLVNYSAIGWRRLQAPVRDQVLSTVDRVSLLHSAFVLARSGMVPLSQALDFASAFGDDPEPLCWKELTASLGYYAKLFRREAFFPQLQRFLGEMFGKVLSRLTWDATADEDMLTARLRSDAIAMLGLANDRDTVKRASELFQQRMASKTSSCLTADLRLVVFKIAAAHSHDATTTHMQHLQTLFETSDFIEEKLDCLAALGLVPDLALKKDALRWALTHVRSQDIQYIFGSVAESSDGAEVAWEFVQDQWAALNAQYPPYVVGRIVSASISRFQSSEQATRVETFMQSRVHDSYARVLDVALERVRTRAAGFARDRDEMAVWVAGLGQEA